MNSKKGINLMSRKDIECFENAKKNGYIIMPSGEAKANGYYREYCKKQEIPYIRVCNYRKYAYVSCDFFTVPGSSEFPDIRGLYDYISSKYTLKPERFLSLCPILMGFTVLKTEAEDLARELFSIAMEAVEAERTQKVVSKDVLDTSATA